MDEFSRLTSSVPAVAAVPAPADALDLQQCRKINVNVHARGCSHDNGDVGCTRGKALTDPTPKGDENSKYEFVLLGMNRSLYTLRWEEMGVAGGHIQGQAVHTTSCDDARG